MTSPSIKNILIGVFVLFALGVITFLLLFLHPSVGDNKKTLYVRFTDIDKVNVGTRVSYAGRPVGEVVRITEIPEARTSRLNQNGEVYVYELTLKVDSGVDVYNTDFISLRTSGLLGERTIEIDPKPLKQGETLKRVEDTILFAATTNSVESTLKQFEEISAKVGLVLDDFHQLMTELQKQKIVDKISHSVDNIVDITDVLNQPEIWKKSINDVKEFTDHLNKSLVSVDQSLENVRQLTHRANTQWSAHVDQTLEAVYQTADNARHLSATTDQIVDKISQGQGTMGQLLVGNDLYLRLKSLLYKGSTIMDDVGTYGVLFHLDKKWQRLQAKRLQLLQKLSTPEEFDLYFANEINQINSSPSHVSMILNESECYPYSLMHNPQFTQQFSHLMKRVEGMEETLKMYNEQVVDQN